MGMAGTVVEEVVEHSTGQQQIRQIAIEIHQLQPDDGSCPVMWRRARLPR